MNSGLSVGKWVVGFEFYELSDFCFPKEGGDSEIFQKLKIKTH